MQMGMSISPAQLPGYIHSIAEEQKPQDGIKLELGVVEGQPDQERHVVHPAQPVHAAPKARLLHHLHTQILHATQCWHTQQRRNGSSEHTGLNKHPLCHLHTQILHATQCWHTQQKFMGYSVHSLVQQMGCHHISSAEWCSWSRKSILASTCTRFARWTPKPRISHSVSEVNIGARHIQLVCCCSLVSKHKQASH